MNDGLSPADGVGAKQTEMPFAIVEGEPYTQLPQDLYIPPQALEVFLEAFEGPLDLLLYLIKRQNLDILDIPIAQITEQYVAYIEMMDDVQLELAGEYLVMAAMLAEIKSRMLLPRYESLEEEEDDPRAELVRRLQEYERYKKAAEDLDALHRLERDVTVAQAQVVDKKVIRLLPEVKIDVVINAFKEVMERAEMYSHHHIQREILSVRQRMSDLLIELKADKFRDFSDLFQPEEGKMGVVVTFLAILELLKESLVEIAQAEPFAPLHVKIAGRVEQESTVVSLTQTN